MEIGDGRCVFDIVMRGTGTHETTTGNELARAAWKLLNECVRDQRGEGGVVSNIGQRGTLGAILRSYDPSKIACGTTPESYSPEDKCDRLMGVIPADVAPPITWGPRGQSGVDLGLPYAWELPEFKCRLEVWGAEDDSTVRDKMSYYEVWTAGVMLAGMCARFGKAGGFKQLGECTIRVCETATRASAQVIAFFL
ncbi:MAG: hypothetical protein LQ338_001490 [Usnochroma carphineum]|nr:MAG: hypothetical protein LQ338_001490 [Usnochroma carphineum]